MSRNCKAAVLVVWTAVCYPAAAAGYTPLKCAMAVTAAERTICASYSLGQAEARMASLYQWATSFVAMGQRGAIQDDQITFIKKREGCGANTKCIQGVYDARIKQLEAVMDNVKRHGPF